tara:strand:+ start:313 stop:1023 length:711 start_codon:yes stop_codon:yes gene_type:complete
MGLFGTSNTSLYNTMQSNQQAQFKTMNNLLTLQENHVEDFFQYHGEAFLSALAQLVGDVVNKTVSEILTNLEFVSASNGNLTLSTDAVTNLNSITQANIELDLQTLLASAINSEVIMQRRMAKTQYLESQGFTMPQEQQMQQQQMPMQQMGNPSGVDPSMIQGNNAAVGMNNAMMQQQMAFNNQSGYPVPPAGYDNMNNPYWIDPQTGQMSYTPPASGLGLANAVSKGIAWAKWLA